MDPQKRADHELLCDSLCRLLSGEFKVDFSIMGIGKAIGRCRSDKDWVMQGLARWIAQHEDAIPLLSGALTAQAAEKLRETLEKRYPADFAKEADAEVRDG